MSKSVCIGLAIISLVFSVGSLARIERPSRTHERYFENTPNELNIYRLYGRFDGKTGFILGGIQGDEPGGFLSADLYPNLVIERGNLIVIPRANFHSIIKNQRGVNGDMNRRFDSDKPESIDDKIVEVIKTLMAEADLFLNLHDGWGYYHPTWIDKNRNPHRFGQSIIADAAHYITKDDTLHLEKMAQEVLQRVNRKIENPDHHLHFMNTNTFAANTDFPEQKKSATYYALSNFGIPAFGIETSKNLPNHTLKIRYHNYVINEFLNLFGIEPEHPSIIYESPRLIYLLISVNNDAPLVIDNNGTVNLLKGDRIRIDHIESNYRRGLSCDILGTGDDQDFQRELPIDSSTQIIVRKDNLIIGKISLQVTAIENDLFTYILSVNGEKTAIFPGQTLNLKRGARLEIVDVLHSQIGSANIKVNLKGYVPNTAYNTGEDRHYSIDTGTLHWKKYSVNGRGKTYPIVVTKNDQEVSRAYINLED